MRTFITSRFVTPGSVQQIILEVLANNNLLKNIVKSTHYYGQPEQGEKLWIGNQIFLQIPEDYDTRKLNRDLISNIQKIEEIYSNEINETSWEMIFRPMGYKGEESLREVPNLYHIDIDIILNEIPNP